MKFLTKTLILIYVILLILRLANCDDKNKWNYFIKNVKNVLLLTGIFKIIKWVLLSPLIALFKMLVNLVFWIILLRLILCLMTTYF